MTDTKPDTLWGTDWTRNGKPKITHTKDQPCCCCQYAHALVDTLVDALEAIAGMCTEKEAFPESFTTKPFDIARQVLAERERREG